MLGTDWSVEDTIINQIIVGVFSHIIISLSDEYQFSRRTISFIFFYFTLKLNHGFLFIQMSVNDAQLMDRWLRVRSNPAPPG